MYYHSEIVKILVGEYKDQFGMVLVCNTRHYPTLYEVVLDDGSLVIALYENEIEEVFLDKI